MNVQEMKTAYLLERWWSAKRRLVDGKKTCGCSWGYWLHEMREEVEKLTDEINRRFPVPEDK